MKKEIPKEVRFIYSRKEKILCWAFAILWKTKYGKKWRKSEFGSTMQSFNKKKDIITAVKQLKATIAVLKGHNIGRYTIYEWKFV